MSKRFVIIEQRGYVSVVDTDEDVELFSFSFEDNEVIGEILTEELEGIVRALNEQDRILKENNLEFP